MIVASLAVHYSLASSGCCDTQGAVMRQVATRRVVATLRQARRGAADLLGKRLDSTDMAFCSCDPHREPLRGYQNECVCV